VNRGRLGMTAPDGPRRAPDELARLGAERADGGEILEELDDIVSDLGGLGRRCRPGRGRREHRRENHQG
jgi:hypothetical protein